MAELTARQYALLVDIEAGHVEADEYGRAQYRLSKQRVSLAANELRRLGLAARPRTGQHWEVLELTATGVNVLAKHRAALMDEVTHG